MALESQSELRPQGQGPRMSPRMRAAAHARPGAVSPATPAPTPLRQSKSLWAGSASFAHFQSSGAEDGLQRRNEDRVQFAVAKGYCPVPSAHCPGAAAVAVSKTAPCAAPGPLRFPPPPLGFSRLPAPSLGRRGGTTKGRQAHYSIAAVPLWATRCHASKRLQTAYASPHINNALYKAGAISRRASLK
uniref:Uncharacterized protein n=1 Tax=Eutreptiella gymnastica TaxID=73025 RepID=A0A7S4G9C3_9EUGL|mmetsp:Transcript_32028/g.51960  ORF Transcript_32028/g.51960 Transcript_32028/m.51960 type:complete len:188 (-) Transcript_32028:993-1556(-)